MHGVAATGKQCPKPGHSICLRCQMGFDLRFNVTQDTTVCVRSLKMSSGMSAGPLGPRYDDLQTMHSHLAYVIDAIIGAITILLWAFSYWWSREREGDSPSHTTILQVGLGIADIIVDVLVLVNLSYYPEYQTLFICFLAAQILSIIFNLCILGYIFKKESQNVRFMLWQLRNAYSFNSLVTLSCLDMQIIRVMHSRIFGLGITNAMITIETRLRLTTASFAALLIENIPQLALEVLIYQKSKSNLVLLSVIMSGFDIGQSIVGLLTWGLFQSQQRTPEFNEQFEAEYWRDSYTPSSLSDPKGSFSTVGSITSFSTAGSTKGSKLYASTPLEESLLSQQEGEASGHRSATSRHELDRHQTTTRGEYDTLDHHRT